MRRPRGLLVPLTTPFDRASGDVAPVDLREHARAALNARSSDPRLVVSACKSLVRGFIAAIVAFLFIAGPALASPPGAVITNQANFNYQDLAGQPVVVPSNQVSVVTAVVRSTAVVEFTRVLTVGTGDYQEPVGPAACFQGGAFVTLADHLEAGVDFNTPRLALQANVYAMEFTDEIALSGELSEIGLPLRRNVDDSYRRGL